MKKLTAANREFIFKYSGVKSIRESEDGESLIIETEFELQKKIKDLFITKLHANILFTVVE